jgi:type 2 lantibiotic biosynthesis protein LanM
MSEKDLAQQLWFIRGSLCALAIGEGQEEDTQWPTYSLTKIPTILEGEQLRERLLTAACSVGDRLEFLALRGENDASWIGLSLLKQKYWSLIPLDWDFYNGISGIVLFLAYLGEIAGEARYTNLAEAGLKTFQRKLERSQTSTMAIGFSGLGGAIYTMTQLGTLWNQSDLLDKAEGIVELLPALIEQDEELDFIGGAAGCIGSLLGLYRCKPSQHILNTAIQCGDHLLAQAQSVKQLNGWISKTITDVPLTGFSHGAAGIAWALLELAAFTREDRFRQAALSAIAYERNFFIPELRTWRDLRRNDQNKFMTAWCHGAPGIGIARLRSLPHLDDAEIRAEINIALQATLSHGFGFNHSLCHGDLGNLELLLQASLTLDDPQWKTQVDRLATIVLESIDQHGWLCGVPLGVETPGLMVGLAGIGYELLRLAEPERVPSVLVLEPPKLNSLAQEEDERTIFS